MNTSRGFLDIAHSLLFEEEEATHTEPSAPAPLGQPQPAAKATAAPDELLGTMRAAVFSTPSHYSKLIEMTQALGNASDLRPSLKALQVGDSGITRESILEDIRSHLATLDHTQQSFQTQLDQKGQQSMGGADAEIEQLQEENRTAAAEIARHTRETADRTAKIASLTESRDSAKKKVEAGRRRIDDAAADIRTSLLDLQQRLKALS